MPNADVIPVFYVWEKGSVYVMARVTGKLKTPVTKGTIASITMKITELPSRTVVVPPSIVVADVIFDTLQKDARWTKDATGYNFAHWIDGAIYLTTPSVIDRLEYTLTPSTTPPNVIPVVVEVLPRELIGT